MNEELLAYALVHASGFDTLQIFEEKLNQLFLETPDINPDLLEMECLSVPDAMAYIRQNISYPHINIELLQKDMILILKEFYLQMPFRDFAGKISCIWDILPFHTSQKDSPFHAAYDFWDWFICEDFEILEKEIRKLVFYYGNPQT